MDATYGPGGQIDIEEVLEGIPRLEYETRGPMTKLWEWAETEHQIKQGLIPAANVPAHERMPDQIIFGGPAASGKTWLALLFLLWAGRRWQGSRIAICRQTRASLIQSACVTLEKILPPEHPMLRGPSRAHRESYWLGSTEYYLGSLEEPGRLFSTEWDIVYVQECVELEADTWEKFGRAVRGQKMPFCLLFGDTNPGPEQHWIWRRAIQGSSLPYEFVGHKDNPAMWDEELQEWKPYGVSTLRRLKAICSSEHNWRRLGLGEWTTARGAVWPEFGLATHQTTLERDDHGFVTERELHQRDVREFYGGMDFGFSAPGSLNIAGLCGDRRLVQIAEVYQRGKLQDWWGDRLVEIHTQYPLSLVFADSAGPEMIAYLNDRLGVPRIGPGAIVVGVKKGPGSRQVGHDIVRRRFSRIDGGPRFLFDSGALIGEPEEALVMASVPTRTVEEIPLFVFRRRSKALSEDAESFEKAIDETDPACHDHGCDSLTYLCVGVEDIEPSEKPKPKLRWNSYGALFDHEAVFRGSEFDQEMDQMSRLYMGERQA